MGQAIGRSYAQISKYELGKDQMTTAMLCRVARALGVSVGWLFGEEPITDDRD
jgi:transcriptional regulator with XRE-family HTH domain